MNRVVNREQPAAPTRPGSFWLLALLIGFCALHGIWSVWAVPAPPDADLLRDLGSTQALLDRNWFGDPTYSGEVVWYPPLIRFLAACIIRLAGVAPLTFWTSAGAWWNLLTPLTFFFMTARLFGRPAAIIAVSAMILMNEAMPGNSLAAAYTPWPFSPNLALPFFFIGVWLISLRGQSTRFLDAALIGAQIGVTFLAHLIPALFLSSIVAAVALGTHGFRVRAFAWLAVVALVELAVASPFLYPLIARYALHIANAYPAEWVDNLMEPTRNKILAMFAVNSAGLLAAIGAVLLRRRLAMPRQAAIILGSWVGVAAIFILRYYGCAGIDQASMVCHSFVLPVHHFMLYLQGAWACLIGFVLWKAISFRVERHGITISPLRIGVASGAGFAAAAAASLFLLQHDLGSAMNARIDDAVHLGWAGLVVLAFAEILRSSKRRTADRSGSYRTRALAALCGGFLAANAAWIMFLPEDQVLAQAGRTDNERFDLAAYQWIVANTRPTDLFVTELPSDSVVPAALSVIAAGRRLVAAPERHSNPYITWEDRDQRRQEYLSAVARDGDQNRGARCAFIADAGRGASAMLLLPNDFMVSPEAAISVFRSRYNTIYRVSATGCPSR